MSNQSTANRIIGQSVRLAMTDSGVSQYKMASHLGVSQPAVWRRLNGEVPFGYAELVSVAELLKVTVDELVGALHTSSDDSPVVPDETTDRAAVPSVGASEGDRVARPSEAIDHTSDAA